MADNTIREHVSDEYIIKRYRMWNALFSLLTFRCSVNSGGRNVGVGRH